MSLTASDKEYLDHLIGSRTGELKGDMRWIKRISITVITIFGGAITIMYPTASGLYNDFTTIKTKISKYESDHLKCHRWEWKTNKGDKT